MVSLDTLWSLICKNLIHVFVILQHGCKTKCKSLYAKRGGGMQSYYFNLFLISMFKNVLEMSAWMVKHYKTGVWLSN